MRSTNRAVAGDKAALRELIERRLVIARAIVRDAFPQRVLEALGALWVEGVEVDWLSFGRRETRNRVELPPYPFERKSFWIDAK